MGTFREPSLYIYSEREREKEREREIGAPMSKIEGFFFTFEPLHIFKN